MTMALMPRHGWFPWLDGEVARLSGDVVETAVAVGLYALDGLRDAGVPVGPVRLCSPHGTLQIYVPLGTRYRWCAAHFVCHGGRSCPVSGAPSNWVGSSCHPVFLQPHSNAPETTDPDALYTHLYAVRSRMRAGEHPAVGRPASAEHRTGRHTEAPPRHDRWSADTASLRPPHLQTIF
ncbi:hypothetical protein ACFU99_03495 [Streptomyces sp. NPDC057654]|uniref:hypothetical protein n=1 Tax=Streptomyces sp. NPDC057654 TaxID=3346196 RepID=UPI0036879505